MAKSARDLAWWVWGILLLLAVGRAALWDHPRHCGCYAVFETAGRNWVQGEDLYDRDLELDVFHYSPLAGALLAPLGLVPTGIGNGLLRLVNMAAFLSAVWWWMRACLPDWLSAGRRGSFFLVLALLCNNYLMDVQVNVLITGLMLGTMAAVAEKRWFVAAALCSLAVYLKVYPLALGLLLALAYPRSFAPRWLLLLILGAALPFLLQDTSYVARQYHDWVSFGANRRYVEHYFQDVMRFHEVAVGPMSRQVYYVWAIAMGAAIAGVCLLQRARGLPAQQLQNLLYGLACAWITAFGPCTEAVTYVLITPALAASFVLAWTRPQPWWFRGMVSFSCLVLTTAQLELLLPFDSPMQDFAVLPVAATVFLVAVSVRGLGDSQTLPISARPIRQVPLAA